MHFAQKHEITLVFAFRSGFQILNKSPNTSHLLSFGLQGRAALGHINEIPLTYN